MYSIAIPIQPYTEYIMRKTGIDETTAGLKSVVEKSTTYGMRTTLHYLAKRPMI